MKISQVTVTENGKQRTYKVPSKRTIALMVFNCVGKATDGCKVDVDAATCKHGRKNWMRILGMI